jgi:hypothetical protein
MHTACNMSGRKEGERPRRELTLGQNQSPSEGGTDYRAVLSSIRADQDRETFVADLRRNKEGLFSLMNDLLNFRKPSHKVKEFQTRAATVPLALYLHAALREYVFDRGDPSFKSTRPDDEELQESREAVAFDAARQVAVRWLHAKPDSEAARAVSVLGIYAPPDQHHTLLQEMWLSVLYFARGQSEKKK